MADFSLNLPAWARQIGYSAEGDFGTYGALTLFKDGKLIKTWGELEKQPNIYEIEGYLLELEKE